MAHIAMHLLYIIYIAYRFQMLEWDTEGQNIKKKN